MSVENKGLQTTYKRMSTIATPPETPPGVSQQAPSSNPRQYRQMYYQDDMPQKEDDTRKRKRVVSPGDPSDHDKRSKVDDLLPHVPNESPAISPQAKQSMVPITPPTRKEKQMNKMEQIKIVLKQNYKPTFYNMFSPKEVVETISELHLQHRFPVNSICAAICDLSWAPAQQRTSSNLPYYEPLELMNNIQSLEQMGFTVAKICEAIVKEDLSEEFSDHLYLEKRYSEYQNNPCIIERMSQHHQDKYQMRRNLSDRDYHFIGHDSTQLQTFDLPSTPPFFSTSPQLMICI